MTCMSGSRPTSLSWKNCTRPPEDWLIVAGDVAERSDDIRAALDLLRRRFTKVIWVPGNHELWTTARDPMQIFGQSRYDYLVNMCDEMGVITPEHPYPVWVEQGGPATIVPMFVLYDYTFLPEGANSKAEGLKIARDRNVVATDEFLLSSEPFATRDAWCRDRLRYTRKRLEDLDWMTPTVLVNHFPLVREPCDALFYPSSRCGVEPPKPRTGIPVTTPHARCTDIYTFREPPGTTTSGLKRYRWAIRGNGPSANHIRGFGRFCRRHIIRPATSTSSVVISRSLSR